MAKAASLASMVTVCAAAYLRRAQLGNDPASSWLAYAIAPGNGARVLQVNATWTVPEYPTTRGGGNAPGWWFGIEPPVNDGKGGADLLIQPILAYGDGTPEFTIFDGYFNWINGGWQQSASRTVKPGDNVTASIVYSATDGSYTQYISSAAHPAPITMNVPPFNAQTFSDVYFVVEHQPNACSEYPANGFVVFRDISIEWDGGARTPAWSGHQFQPACNSQAHVVDASTLKFTWSTQ